MSELLFTTLTLAAFITTLLVIPLAIADRVRRRDEANRLPRLEKRIRRHRL